MWFHPAVAKRRVTGCVLRRENGGRVQMYTHIHERKGKVSAL